MVSLINLLGIYSRLNQPSIKQLSRAEDNIIITRLAKRVRDMGLVQAKRDRGTIYSLTSELCT